MQLGVLSLRLFVSLNLFVLCCAGRLGADTELNIPGYRIEWHDEFEEPSVDPAKWDVNVGVNAWYQRASDGRFVEPHWFNEDFEPWLSAGTINGERQYYSPDNVTVNAGVLEIRSDVETVTDPVGLYDPGFHQYTSGKLNTADEFQFRFGIVRWRAQLPAGQGMWPALWMLNAPDPWFWDDEIDVMEARGSQPTITTSAHHYKVDVGGGNLQNSYNFGELNAGVNLQQGFHEYTLQWEPTFLQTWMDDKVVFYDNFAIPQGPMFLIMNAAVGGMFDGAVSDNGIFPTYFKIDWVRVWQEASTPTDLASGGFEKFQGPQWANWNTRDSGNLAVYSTNPLHGAHSVQIGWREPAESGGETPDETGDANLFTDGTASEWSGYLNQLAETGEVISGAPENPGNIPATLGSDTAILPIHQNAPSPRANAVIYRQLDGAGLLGAELQFSGTVTIQETFQPDTTAIAFIRIFDLQYRFTDLAAPVMTGGDFNIQADIPASNVSIIQVGLETTGPTGSTGSLAATDLNLNDVGVQPPPPPSENATGFIQTVVAVPGATVNYGVLAANHPSDPIGPGAYGRLKLEFLDGNESPISEESTIIIDALSSPAAVPYSFSAVAPANTAFARLSVERVTDDPLTDAAGSLLVDAAFLQASTATELPLITSQPPAELTVNAGESVNLSVVLSSPSPVAYQWYHNGVKTRTAQALQFTATPGSSGRLFVVASNDAGPVISTPTRLTVLNPDSDGDGLSDYEEIYITQTDPNDPLSVLRISSFAVDNGQLSLSFSSVPGVTYSLEASPDLVDWQSLGSPFAASEDSHSLMQALPVDPQPRFFRIRAIP